MDLYLMASEETAKARLESADSTEEEALRKFDEIYEPLRRYLMCVGASPTQADDAAQEAFMRLVRHLKKNGLPPHPCGWIFHVARNYLWDERRSARRHRTLSLDAAMARGGSPPDPRGNPEQQILGKERAQLLRTAITKLSEQQRECILLRSAGLRYREIADVMGLNLSSVGTLVHRAMVRLSEELR